MFPEAGFSLLPRLPCRLACLSKRLFACPRRLPETLRRRCVAPREWCTSATNLTETAGSVLAWKLRSIRRLPGQSTAQVERRLLALKFKSQALFPPGLAPDQSSSYFEKTLPPP